MYFLIRPMWVIKPTMCRWEVEMIGRFVGWWFVCHVFFHPSWGSVRKADRKQHVHQTNIYKPTSVQPQLSPKKTIHQSINHPLHWPHQKPPPSPPKKKHQTKAKTPPPKTFPPLPRPWDLFWKDERSPNHIQSTKSEYSDVPRTNFDPSDCHQSTNVLWLMERSPRKPPSSLVVNNHQWYQAHRWHKGLFCYDERWPQVILTTKGKEQWRMRRAWSQRTEWCAVGSASTLPESKVVNQHTELEHTPSNLY